MEHQKEHQYLLQGDEVTVERMCMKFSARWKAAFDARDRQAFEAMIHDDFAFVRHQLGKDLHKAEMVNIWSADGPRPVRRNYRIVYENDDILVTHQFMVFPSGDKESVMVVMLLKGGQLYRMETGATPMV
ncbi:MULTISPECIES: nuclear transport factor 2 family protein [unclassified Ruegeria]|uniref:nuclear transport factor 2 family protein n=1 Tax=unclassified Ruegeria TaxID=2625375 RepID=UPI00149258DD|nr:MULTISPECIES: nuclear transport factor 2 family protein [unclassified Ruegeria]NOD49901.1 DUF4440 domain-containing protein [Ruegeria sp. HKCCD5849]NOD54228.1 DUF4440 domain-containing protein [Ruegeria sp. HKCCD5851]NOD70189.1 DUF4440 domain-containing protein [Ruegeria sp. HKCCD7303]